MASRPPPRYVVRRHDDAGNRRQRLWLGLLWLASLLAVAVAVFLLTRHVAPVLHDRRQQKALQLKIDDLEQQVANLQRAAQVNAVATGLLHGTLAQREEEISGLRTDLAFYSRLVGGDNLQGLKLHQVNLQPVAGTRGWNITLSLTQNAKRGDETTGTATLSVEGLRGNKVVELDWPALGDDAQKDGLAFHFMYFQQLHGTIVLPADFRPTRLHIRIQPAGDTPIDQTVAWSDALSGNISQARGSEDAQP